VSTVAIVPAKDRADSVAETVRALLGVDGVDGVVVVDDGSVDDTSAQAEGAGARVVRLPVNRGKGGAVAAGVAAAPHADVYLLIDADVGDTAAVAHALLAPVAAGHADMAIGVLPAAGRRAGFGKVRDLARRGIRRACGFEARAPLSGQRAVRGDMLRSLDLAERFGLETALTIDAVRAGARVVEVDVAMEHRHTGRTVSGFGHRARQGADIVRALWPRLTSARQRVGAVVLLFVVLAGASLFESSRSFPSSEAGPGGVRQVVLVGIPKLAWTDLDPQTMPVLHRLVRTGAVAATSVRTLSGQPTTVEGYATLGAGARVKADEQSVAAFDADEMVEGVTAAAALQGRTGVESNGEVAVVGAPAVRRLNQGKHLPSQPGALGDALHAAGMRTAVIGNADTGSTLLPVGSAARPRSRPAAVALMDRNGRVDFGHVGPSLLAHGSSDPFSRAADVEAMTRAFDRAQDQADIVLIDTGDMDRSAAFAAVATAGRAAEVRRAALANADQLLGHVVASVGADTLVLVVSVDPPGDEWHTTPMVATRPGLPRGYLHSPSVRRLGVVTLTDVAPTVLDALGVAVPQAMIGHPLRYHPGDGDVGSLERLDRDAAFRERIYFPITLGYIIFQAVIYLLAMVSFGRLGGVGRAGAVLKWIVLGVAAWPLATFVLRAVPGVARLNGAAVFVLLAADVVIVLLALALASGGRRHSLSALSWILGATIALLAVDVAFGARLQTSSILGYSLHTAARFTGLGNTAFAVLAASTVLFGVIHVWAAPRRSEALWTVGALFAFVVLLDGAPSLGDDVGGILTLVPVFGITLFVLSGRKVRLRTLVVVGLCAAAVLAVATGVDLLRPAESRTHLGQLVTDMRTSGSGTFTTTLARKFATNLRTYKSVWLWVIVIIAVYLVFFVAWGRGWARLVPKGSPLRVGVLAVLAAGLAGNFLNDSGAVVTALVFVYLGPFVTMLALGQEAESSGAGVQGAGP
jgi:hypothetical protein